MRRFLLCTACTALLLSLPSGPVSAQRAGGKGGAGSSAAPDAGAPPLEEPSDTPLQAPRLRAPEVEPPDVEIEPDEPSGEEEEGGSGSPGATESGEAGEVEPSEEASPGATATMLEEAQPEAPAAEPSSNPIMGEWTAPASVLTLHGYMRLRGEIWDHFFLGRGWVDSGQAPFARYAPLPRCGSGVTGTGCGEDRLRFANMRLRLRPTLALSDDVRVHMTMDVFDNLVLGSTPDSEGWVAAGTSTASGFSRTERTPGQPIDSFTLTQEPPSALRNGFQDSIRVRRAWAEVTNRGIGQLRFGRMGSEWGLGIFQNAGDGLDSDTSTDVDRVMGITKVAGFYIVGSWDWANEGFLINDPSDPSFYPIDATNQDDLRQWTLAVAHRETEEDQKAALDRGDWVLNGGLYFVIRKQKLSSAGIANPFSTEDTPTFFNRGLRSYIPDLWGQFLWKGLRLETEAVLVTGKVENILASSDDGDSRKYKLLQLGWAFEGEYRLLDDKLGIYLYTGLATGDSNVDGLSSQESMLQQNPGSGDNRISTFTFHPDYRIDLILWRNIMQRVAGAWYMRPGVSYDFLRNSFGQLLGARFDMVYSRAMAQVQTYGSDPNLGLEMDLSAYYRSEDGPELWDGFHAVAQFGLLFPFAGLGTPRDYTPKIDPNKAWVFRAIMGVEF